MDAAADPPDGWLYDGADHIPFPDLRETLARMYAAEWAREVALAAPPAWPVVIDLADL